MRFFASLDRQRFEEKINCLLNKNREFVAVTDLTQYDNVSGYYMMVLDKYCQVYIGTAVNIKRRIQQHWSKSKSLDRLLFPMYAVEKSALSIDSFRALDTIRIFAYKSSEIYTH